MIRELPPHGPYRLLQITKGGLAILDGREKFRVPTSLLDLAITLTWDNLPIAANWCGAADLFDTRYLLLVPTPEGEEVAQVGDTVVKHDDGSFTAIHTTHASLP